MRERSQFPRAQPFGKYILLDKIAEGGMAEIFLAIEDTGGAGRRFVTVKRIRPELSRDADYIEFFLTEGRISLKCAHPNLPHVYEVGTIDGVRFLAMDFIRGHTLLDVLRGAQRSKSKLSVAAAVHIGRGIAAALEHVHSLSDVDGTPLSVIHRDVTPQNVMVSSAGAVVLIDFGIVRSRVQIHHTQAGIIKGKFGYLAPEQVAGDGAFDCRADIFALGVVLHETLAGRPLFRVPGDDASTVERLVSAPIPDLRSLRPDVPAALADLVKEALARDPQARIPSATELLARIDTAAEAASLYTSPNRLRAEVAKLCGPRESWSITFPTGDELAGDTDAETLYAENDDLLRDPDLAYFLARAAIDQ